MTKDRYVIITAAFDRRPEFGRSLRWIGPELEHALAPIDDTAGPRPTRTWAGIVDGPTYERFAAAWRLPDEFREANPTRRTYTLDGMNWEADDEAPITYVTVQVAPVHVTATRKTPGARARRRTSTAGRRSGSHRGSPVPTEGWKERLA